jgi:hypothetical protein
MPYEFTLLQYYTIGGSQFCSEQPVTEGWHSTCEEITHPVDNAAMCWLSPCLVVLLLQHRLQKTESRITLLFSSGAQASHWPMDCHSHTVTLHYQLVTNTVMFDWPSSTMLHCYTACRCPSKSNCIASIGIAKQFCTCRRP